MHKTIRSSKGFQTVVMLLVLISFITPAPGARIIHRQEKM